MNINTFSTSTPSNRRSWANRRVWVEPPAPRPHPVAEWLYGGRLPLADLGPPPSAGTLALLGAVAAIFAGALALALS